MARGLLSTHDKGTRGVWRSAWAAVLVMALAFAAGCGSDPAGQTKNSGTTIQSLKAKYAASREYDVADKEIVLGQRESTTFKLGTPSGVEYKKWFKGSHAATPFVMFRDPDLHQVERTYTEADTDQDGTLPISPKGLYATDVIWRNEDGTTARNSHGELVRLKLSGDGMWGSREMLYLAQYNDLETGALLKRPLVHIIRIKPAANQIARPSATMQVGDDGNVKISWKPVPGAAGYVVIKSFSLEKAEKPDRNGDVVPQVTGRDMLASTTGTAWSSDERSRIGLQSVSVSAEDLLNDGGTLLEQEHYGDSIDYDLFVVAIDKQSRASLESPHIASRDIVYKIPMSLAIHALRKEHPTAPQTIADIPSTYPVVMADGVVRNFRLQLDADAATPYTNRRNNVDMVKIPYRIVGTDLTGELDVRRSEKDYRQEIAERNKESLATQSTGALSVVTPVETREDIVAKKDSYSDSVPYTDYRVESHSALEAYLGANIAVGKEYLDLKSFPEAADESTLKAAVDAVRDRNPILPRIVSYYYSPTKKIVQLRYDNLAASLAQVKELVGKVSDIRKQIIKEGMTELQKVSAINRYIADHAQYDYEALSKRDETVAVADQQGDNSQEALKAQRELWHAYDYAWEPEGVLLKGKGVCASYAAAFQLLASQSELESVYVTGDAAGGKHAWNYVKIGGQWKVVDPTWNDSATNPDAYLNLSLNDDRYLSTHSPDQFFVTQYHAS